MKLKELADRLGLSPTTVSRALNGFPEVSEVTRRRVVEAARRFDYRPNASAQRLATGRAGAIGIVFPIERSLYRDPHFVEFLGGLGERLARDDLDIVLSPSAASHEMAAYRRLAAGLRVDGLVLSLPVPHDERVKVLAELGIPFVLHGRTDSRVPHAWLDIDNAAAFRHATEHLIALGHRHIGLINGDIRYTFARDRERGFRSALAAAGIAVEERLIAGGTMTDEAGYHTASGFLAMTPRPTALLVSSMMLSLGAFRAIRAAGLELGRQVSMIAHDDVFPFLNPDAMVPPMSTVRSSIREAGRRIGEMVMDILDGRDPQTLHEVWKTELVIRASTGPAP